MKKDDKIFVYHPSAFLKNARLLDVSFRIGPGDDIFFDERFYFSYCLG